MNHRLRGMHQCHPDIIQVSRISSLIGNAVLIALAAVYLIVAAYKDWTFLPGWIALGLFALSLIWYTWFAPGLFYRTFGFKVSDEELELRSGWIWLNDTVIPMTRIQHVELESGPMLRKYGLAEVKVVTAAKTHVIKALKLEEAEKLKQQIGELAKVVEHDE